MPRGQFDRTERRARTREALLGAAARVYARRGFDGATLDEVAEEAGFTKGAVYDHFGSKEKLLLALLDEHLSEQIAEQRSLFDPSKATSDRPRAGADRWMQALEDDPDAFRLFVEVWVQAQRNEELRSRVVAGMDSWRATFTEFATARTENGRLEAPEAVIEQFASVMLAFATGLGIVKLADPETVSDRLLGAVFVVLIQALESSEEARELLAESAIAQRRRPTPR
jgi:AcrR family transcriptional regulator